LGKMRDAAESTTNVCFPDRRRPVTSDGKLFWMPARLFSVREGVALAKTKISGTEVSLDHGFVPRHSRAITRPLIAAGATIAGLTVWETWDVFGTGVQELTTGVFGVQVTIDTSSAGFTTLPNYFAALQGSFVSADNQGNQSITALYLDHIDQPTINGFVFRFVLSILASSTGRGSAFEQIGLRDFLTQAGAYVSWLGIEPVRTVASSIQQIRLE
jgi:hypothetical protein